MEDLIYALIGVVVAGPILLVVNKALEGKKSESKVEEKSSWKRIEEMKTKFETLLEAILKKDDTKYKTLHSDLSEKEKQIFSKYVNTKLEKSKPGDPPVDEQQITRIEVIKWIASVIIETGIVLLIAYFLYVFLSK